MITIGFSIKLSNTFLATDSRKKEFCHLRQDSDYTILNQRQREGSEASHIIMLSNSPFHFKKPSTRSE